MKEKKLLGNNQPSPFVVVLKGKVRKAGSMPEAQRMQRSIEAGFKENYPGESSRRAHIYGMVR